MKLWLISQDVNRGYDTYDSAVVAAMTEREALQTHPSGGEWNNWGDCWANNPEQVTASFVGDAAPGTLAGVVLASFNAG
jgi:hypothetical protein